MNEFNGFNYKKDEAKEKKKKVLLIGIGACIVIIILLALMIMYYQRVDAHTFKLYLDDGQVQVSQGFYYRNDKGETYVRARDIASLIGWSYQNGEYGSYTEDTNSGYIQNEYEIASFVAGSTTLKKYIQVTATPYKDEQGQEVEPYQTNSENGTLETSTLELPVVSQDGQIYFPLKHLCDICNCRVVYENEYRMYIYEQNYLLNLAQTRAAELGYKSVSGIYENMRTLGYGLMCVSNGTMYGIVDIYSGSTVLGLKYNDMIFAQNNKEFFVKTTVGDEESVGIINLDGKTVVQPKSYDNIQILSDELGLYLVEKDEKYGVLDKTGEVIVHCEYDSIGIPETLLTSLEFSVEDNKYILFDNTIIVESDGKYGLYNIEGEQTLPVSYSGIGYLVDEDEDAPKSAESVLTIELDDLEMVDGENRDVKGIILKNTDSLYGIYDAVSEKQILPCACDSIYATTVRGEVNYYFEFNGQTDELRSNIESNPNYFES